MPDALDALAGSLRGREGRFLLGVAGAPGAGKSTLAAALCAALGDEAALVPMDGFHLADDVLAGLGRADRKGAPDTFDADGYVALLRRLRDQESVVYAPRFRRELELAEAGALAVRPAVRVVVTEGNYLRCDGACARVRHLLHETWFVDVAHDLRRSRLVARHVAHGRSPEAAQRWVDAVDEPNARTVLASRSRADRLISL